MRLYKVDVQPGGIVPFHFHEAPLTSYIEEGQLTLKTKKGKSTTFREGDSFVLAADTPAHTMANNGKVPAVMWVTVAAAEAAIANECQSVIVCRHKENWNKIGPEKRASQATNVNGLNSLLNGFTNT